VSAGSGPGRDHRLPRSRRIHRSADIIALLRRGKRSRTTHLDVYDSAAPGRFPRAGVIVGRYGRPVVERNLLKRRLREILRRDVLPALRAADRAVDVLVRVRREAYGAGYRELRDELRGWMSERWPAESSSP